MENATFLSVRVPADLRNRLKALAARRGERLQDLVGGLIREWVTDAERRAPELGDVVTRLRDMEASLRARGIGALWVFGSTARGEARPDSDVDLIVDLAPGADITLFAFEDIRDDLRTRLGHPVDLGERALLREDAAASADREMVRVF